MCILWVPAESCVCVCVGGGGGGGGGEREVREGGRIVDCASIEMQSVSVWKERPPCTLCALVAPMCPNYEIGERSNTKWSKRDHWIAAEEQQPTLGDGEINS